MPELFGYALNFLGVTWTAPGTLEKRAVWTLFALTGLLSSLPLARSLDGFILHYLHDKAVIPDDARLTASRLFESQFLPRPEIAQQVAQEDEDGSGGPWASGASDTLQEVWTKTRCLRAAVLKLVKDNPGKYREFQRRFELELDELGALYAYQSRRLCEFAKWKAQRMPVAGGAPCAQARENDIAVEKARIKLEYKVDALFYRLCLLSSLLVFATETQIDSINRRFKALGFQLAVSPLPGVDVDTILKTCAAVFLTILIPSALYGFVTQAFHLPSDELSRLVPRDWTDALVWSLFGVLMHGCAVYIAVRGKRILAKKALALSTSEMRANQLSRNVIVSVATLAITWVLGVVWIFLFSGQFRPFFAWAFLPAATAFFTTVYIDRVIHARRVDAVLIATHGATMAAIATVITFATVAQGFADLRPLVVAFTIYASLTAALVGVSVGLIFPKAYVEAFKGYARRGERNAREVEGNSGVSLAGAG